MNHNQQASKSRMKQALALDLVLPEELATAVHQNRWMKLARPEAHPRALGRSAAPGELDPAGHGHGLTHAAEAGLAIRGKADWQWRSGASASS